MITSRGWFVIGFLSAIALYAGLYLMGHIWYTETGYCWGTMVECYR